MAQSLDNRINSALRSAARLKDVESVIEAVGTEIAATQVKLDTENARSIDPALTTPQAREARNNAADLEHDIRRLNASLGMLQEKRDRIISEDEESRRQAQYEEAKAERDAVARLIRERYPHIASELLALVKRIDASNALCDNANRQRPAGVASLAQAEELARGASYYWPMDRGGGPMIRISEMSVPFLGRSGGYLPVIGTNQLGATEHGYAAQWERQIQEDLAFAETPMEGVDAAPIPETQNA